MPLDDVKKGAAGLDPATAAAIAAYGANDDNIVPHTVIRVRTCYMDWNVDRQLLALTYKPVIMVCDVDCSNHGGYVWGSGPIYTSDSAYCRAGQHYTGSKTFVITRYSNSW